MRTISIFFIIIFSLYGFSEETTKVDSTERTYLPTQTKDEANNNDLSYELKKLQEDQQQIKEKISDVERVAPITQKNSEPSEKKSPTISESKSGSSRIKNRGTIEKGEVNNSNLKSQDPRYSNELKAVMEVPKILDTAIGSFNIGDATCELHYAYSSEYSDPFSSSKSEREILLTNQHISAKSFRSVKDMGSLNLETQCWIYLRVDASQTVSPLKVFIPSEKDTSILSYSGPIKSSIRQNIEYLNKVVGGTLLFKEPLELSGKKITGQFSFRSQFRQVGPTVFASHKNGQEIKDEKAAPYQAFLNQIKNSPTRRSIASVPNTPIEAKPNELTSEMAEILKVSEKDISFLKGYINKQAGVATMIIINNNDLTKKFGIVIMRRNDGFWTVENAKWVENLPAWVSE